MWFNRRLNMKKFIRDDKKYTLSEIKKANSRLVYWINLDNSIETIEYGHKCMKNFFVAKTMKKALKIAKKYKAKNFERLIECDLGRWCIKVWDRV
jgi:hypothetical protein